MSTQVWLISYTVNGEKRQVVHVLNAIADYRAFDPKATVRQIDVAFVADVIEAAKNARASLQHMRGPEAVIHARTAELDAVLARVGGVA